MNFNLLYEDCCDRRYNPDHYVFTHYQTLCSTEREDKYAKHTMNAMNFISATIIRYYAVVIRHRKHESIFSQTQDMTTQSLVPICEKIYLLIK